MVKTDGKDVRRGILAGAVIALAMLLLGACTSAPAPATTTAPAVAAEVTAAPTPSPAVGTQVGREFRWRVVGGDPCNPRAGCTATRALQYSGWPVAVQEELKRRVLGDAPREVLIRPGWRGWMTWGSVTFKFHPNTVAAWGGNRSEPAHEWVATHEGRDYILLQVRRCQNWGGYVREALPLPPRPPATTPRVYCPGGRE